MSARVAPHIIHSKRSIVRTVELNCSGIGEPEGAIVDSLLLMSAGCQPQHLELLSLLGPMRLSFKIQYA